MIRARGGTDDVVENEVPAARGPTARLHCQLAQSLGTATGDGGMSRLPMDSQVDETSRDELLHQDASRAGQGPLPESPKPGVRRPPRLSATAIRKLQWLWRHLFSREASVWYADRGAGPTTCDRGLSCCRRAYREGRSLTTPSALGPDGTRRGSIRPGDCHSTVYIYQLGKAGTALRRLAWPATRRSAT